MYYNPFAAVSFTQKQNGESKHLRHMKMRQTRIYVVHPNLGVTSTNCLDFLLNSSTKVTKVQSDAASFPIYLGQTRLEYQAVTFIPNTGIRPTFTCFQFFLEPLTEYSFYEH